MKAHGSDDEILLLIHIRRKQAVASMGQIITDFAEHGAVPDIELIVEYFMSITFCIELMLKLLSDDWKSHNIGSMYQKTFGKCHKNPMLLHDIGEAIKDQKYIFEPANGLTENIPEIESLYKKLLTEIRRTRDTFDICKSITLPKSFCEFIADNPELFVNHLPRFFVQPSKELHPALRGDTTVGHRVHNVRGIFLDHANKSGEFKFSTMRKSMT